ncbi:MAG: glycosyltransferase family 2 protein [Cyclobacteriaceae bacterium]
MGPFFSVILPTYNRELFLEKTIQSVLEQSVTDFELLIIDDGSTDGTKKLVNHYIKKDQRITYFYQENLERAKARNLGISKAKGQFLVFLDSDDWWYVSHLEVLQKAIDQYEECNFFANSYQYTVQGDTKQHTYLSKLDTGVYDYRLLIEGNHLSCNFCVKNNKNLFFNENEKILFFEDWELLMRGLKDQKLYFTNEVTLCMNDHSERSMNKDHQLIIDRRLYTSQILSSKLNLSKYENNQLIGFSHLFCASQYYLNRQKKQSFRFLMQSINRKVFTLESVKLLVKLLIK